MFRGWRIIFGSAVVVCGLLLPANAAKLARAAPQTPVEQPDWELQLAARYAELVKLNGNGTDQELANRLLKMKDVDQKARRPMMDQNINSLPPQEMKKLTDSMTATDAGLTAQLKEIVAAKGWPTIALVGMEASRAAALILVHTEDHVWQKSLLPHLQGLVQQDKITGDDIALLVDKTLRADGKPQRFGSQFDFKNGTMVMWPVEDPTHLDALRQQYLLPPMEDYKMMLEQTYHMKTQ